MRALLLLPFALTASLAVACSSDSSNGNAPVLAEYPPGPYGTEDGDVLPNFELQGFANPTAEGPSKDTSFGSFDIKSLAESKAKYALVHVSTADSELSQLAATELAEGGKELVEKGAQIVEVLAKSDGSAATRGELETWLDTYDLWVSAAVDAPESPLTVLDAAGSAESAFIIEMPEMKVTWAAHGVEGFTTVQDGLHWLHSLLEE